MWVFVSRILQVLFNVGAVVGNQLKQAWVVARALILAGAALLAKYWGARLAWRLVIAAIFIGLMTTATSAILNLAIPEMQDVLSLFAPADVIRRHEGIYHVFWDCGFNLQAFFRMLRRVASALVTAWTCRRLWSVFLVRRLVNPPL